MQPTGGGGVFVQHESAAYLTLCTHAYHMFIPQKFMFMPWFKPLMLMFMFMCS